MIRTLPYKEPVIIDAYSGVAGNVAALMCTDIGEDIILKNHFLITYSKMLHAPGFNWLYYDDNYKIQENICEWIEGGELINKVKQSIQQGYYVHLYLNHYFLKCSDTYQRANKFHDCATIFGYDDDKQEFIIGDNYYNGKYRIEKITYEEFLAARNGAKGYPAFRFRIKQELKLIDKEILIKLLHSYYYSDVTLNEFEINPNNIRLKDDEVTCGLEYYNILKEQVVSFATHKYEIRTFVVLCNHMMMYELIEKYLRRTRIHFDKEYVRKETKNLIDISNKMKILYIKLSIKFNEEKKERLYEYICECMEAEKNILEYLIGVFSER